MTPIYDAETINRELARLAPQIIEDLGRNFTMVGILTGGFIFAAALVRALQTAGADPEVDFIQLSSYGAARESAGTVRWLKNLTAPVEGQKVLLVDDVLESGRSLFAAREMMVEKGARKVQVAVAVSKRVERAHPLEADHCLFESDGSAFLVGYGMDDAGRKRGIPFIGGV